MDRKSMLQVMNLSTEIKTPAGTIHPSRLLNFGISQGETLGLVGESGSGKTQTALTLVGLSSIDPGVTGGSIHFNFSDKKVSILQQLNDFIKKKNGYLKKNYRAWRRNQNFIFSNLWGRKVAIIFQDPQTSLNPYKTILSQMSESLSHVEGGAKKENMRQAAIYWLASVRINNPQSIVDCYPFELSGGMAQRVMIAMALASDPEFLILDEPTTGLDVTTQAAIVSLLKEIKKYQKLSQLLISHDLGLVGHLADSIAVMYAGYLFEYGPASTILDPYQKNKHPYTEGLLAALYKEPHLNKIENDVPDLYNLPHGCPFHTRCHYYLRQDQNFPVNLCSTKLPALIQTEESEKHYMRCWLHKEIED